MASTARKVLTQWTAAVPALAIVLLALTWGRELGPALVVVVAASRPGPEFSPVQLTFAAVASLALYGAFVLT